MDVYYKSKFTGTEIDQRLAQGTYDDAVKAGFTGTKEEFDQLTWAFGKEQQELLKTAQQQRADKLETESKNIVEAINEVYRNTNNAQESFINELSKKQNIEDNNLQTVDKTIVGAINEILTSSVGRIDETSDGTGEKFNVSSGTVASGAFSHAENEGAKATGKGSHSEGYKCLASGEYSHAEGYFCEASGNESHAEGQGTIASGIYSHAEGWQTRATNSNEHAEGAYNYSNAGTTSATKTRMSVGIGSQDYDRRNALEIMANGDVYVYGVGDYHGNNATSDSAKSIQEVIGQGSDPSDKVGKVDPDSDGTGEIFNYYTGNHAKGYYSHAEGMWTTANNSYEHACGFKNVSHTGETDDQKTRFSIGIGDISIAHDPTNAVEVTADGNVFIYGVNGYDGTEVSISTSLQDYLNYHVGVGKKYNNNGGEVFNAINNNEATGSDSHAEGFFTYAKGSASHAEGSSNTAVGASSHVEGLGNQAKGNHSHAEGDSVEANGENSHAEGESTYADGKNSHAEGYQTRALGNNSHTEGELTRAEGVSSHAEGRYTEAVNNYEHAEGCFNVSNTGSTEDKITRHSVGIGQLSAGKNAHEIMANGDHYIYGIGGYDGTEIKSDTNGIKTLQDVINTKVDKIDGKQLSTNDYTTAEKEKLAGLENYDDTSLRNELQQTETGVATANSEIEKLKSSKQDILVSGENIKTINGTSILGNGDITIENSEVTWNNVTGKPSFATVATSGSYSNLTGTPDLSTYQTKSDETLQTTDKTVVGAINELLIKVQELKTKNTELESRLAALEGTN